MPHQTPHPHLTPHLTPHPWPVSSDPSSSTSAIAASISASFCASTSWVLKARPVLHTQSLSQHANLLVPGRAAQLQAEDDEEAYRSLLVAQGMGADSHQLHPCLHALTTVGLTARFGRP
jgi:hypothetical protein